MRPIPQFPADLVTFKKKYLMYSATCQIWCCSIKCGRTTYIQRPAKCRIFGFFTKEAIFVTKLYGNATVRTSQGLFVARYNE